MYFFTNKFNTCTLVTILLNKAQKAILYPFEVEDYKMVQISKIVDKTIMIKYLKD